MNVLIGLIAALVLAVFGAVVQGASPSHGPRDYLQPGTGTDQCSLPLSQRTGGWVCVETSPYATP